MSSELPPPPVEERRPQADASRDHNLTFLTAQPALLAGDAVVPLSRAVLTLEGADRLTWLDSLTSQSLAKLAPGESAETLLLDPTGRIEHQLRVVDDGTVTYLLVDADRAEALQSFLSKMVFTLRVAVGRLDAPVVGAFVDLPGVVWRDPWASIVEGGWQYAGTRPDAPEWTYREIILSEPTSLPAVDPLALEALRIAAWRPDIRDTDEKSIPHELDWMRSAVHLSKGCYRGQETVAKVHNLGHPPRRLVLLHLDGVLPAAGDVVTLGGGKPNRHRGRRCRFAERAVGTVTAAAVHYELGPIALAIVKRSTPVDAQLDVTVDGIPVAAAQEVIVPPDAGAVADIPRIPRLGAVRPTGWRRAAPAVEERRKRRVSKPAER